MASLNISVTIPAVEKLLEYTVSGIGSVAGVMFAPLIASRRAKAGLISAQGKSDELTALAEGHSNALQRIAKANEEVFEMLNTPGLSTQSQLSLGGAIEQMVKFQSEKRISNVESVVTGAATILGDEDVPNSQPDHDWTARFFGDVQDISTPEAQLLWKKVLAGEVRRPGSTSLLALTILRNLDQRTAQQFKQLCSLAVSIDHNGEFLDARVPSLGIDAGSNGLKEYGLSFNVLNNLNEHGLVIPDYNSWNDYSLCFGKSIPGGLGESHTQVRFPFSHQGQNWILLPQQVGVKGSELRVSGVALTRSGRELMKVVDLDAADDYTRNLKSFFDRQGFNMIESEEAGVHPLDC